MGNGAPASVMSMAKKPNAKFKGAGGPLSVAISPFPRITLTLTATGSTLRSIFTERTSLHQS